MVELPELIGPDVEPKPVAPGVIVPIEVRIAGSDAPERKQFL